MSDVLLSNVGSEDFKNFFGDEPSYYVDKTRFIKEALLTSVECFLFTRPRRFGKTLWMTTLKTFLEIDPNNPGNTATQERYFKNLDIFKEQEFCSKYMGQFPVLFISFKASYLNTSYESALRRLGNDISLVAKGFPFLLESNKLSEDEIEDLKKILGLSSKKLSISDYETTISSSLVTLTYLLKKHFDRKVILLIDEYDVPFAKTCNTNYYEKFKGIYANMLNSVLKTNENVFKSYVTGCLKVAKESIFTDLNAFKSYGLTDNDFNSLFGFTKIEVEKMLLSSNLSSKFRIVKKWYDGYLIGGEEIFCPWDVCNYILDTCKKTKNKPKAYRIHTGSVDLARDIFVRTPELYSADFQKLIERKTINVKLNEEINYQLLANVNKNIVNNTNIISAQVDTSSFWTLLFMSGYLTPSKKQPKIGLTSLCIPNECVNTCLNDLLKWCFSTQNVTYSERISPIASALNGGDTKSLENVLSNLLLGYVSIMDHAVKGPKENYYHGFLNGVFSQALTGQILKYDSNIELGAGRADISIVIVLKAQDNKSSPVGIIIEIKATSDPLKLVGKSQDALAQIENKEYYKGVFAKNPRVDFIKTFGIAFCDKDCSIAFKEYNR